MSKQYKTFIASKFKLSLDLTSKCQGIMQYFNTPKRLTTNTHTRVSIQVTYLQQMKRYIFLSVLYKLVCILFFAYQGYKCIDSYLCQSTVSKTSSVDQQKLPRPLICISTYRFEYSNAQKLNLSSEDYKRYRKGNWTLNFNSEDEVYEKLLPKFHDLVEQIQIGKFLNPVGDAYEKIKFPVDENTDLTDWGIEIERKDHYVQLKNYCLKFRYSLYLSSLK